MTDEPEWLERDALILKHAESLRLFGGAEGIRNGDGHESALMRPIYAWGYGGEERHSHLVAGYALGIMKNHPFVDGNRRAAFSACVGFLRINGWNLRSDKTEAYRAMVALAAGEMTEQAFGNWLAAHLESRPK